MRTVFLCLAAGCTNLPDTQRFAACFASDALATAAETYPYGTESAVDGAVVASGVGDEPAGCFDGRAVGREPDAGDATWLTVADADDVEWTVAFRFPRPLAPPPEAGEIVSVSASYVGFTFAPDTGRVELRHDGALYAYVGESGSVAGLTPPEGASFALGDVAGTVHNQCLNWKAYDLDVDGTVVPYGGTAMVGGVEVFHGGVEVETRSKGCADAFAAYAAVGMAPPITE